MPTNLAIGFLVLGGVLVLIGLVGGQFKIFGAEVSARAGRAGRVLASLLGVALLAVAATTLIPWEKPEPPREEVRFNDSAFLGTCQQRGTEDGCKCLLRTLKSRAPEAELIAMDRRASEGQASLADVQLVAEAASTCR